MNDSTPTVVLEKLIPMAPRAAFEAWLDPVALRHFMCPTPGSSVGRVECDPRVGGKFLIMMQVGGQDLPMSGEYLEIERYTRLAFTWHSKFAGEGSRVTLHFAAASGGHTRLTLEHAGLADAELRTQHNGGWDNILMELSALAGRAA